MNKINLAIFVLAIVGIVGCNDSNIKTTGSNIKTSSKFSISTIDLTLTQSVKPKLVYHSELELQKLLHARVSKLLSNKQLLTEKKSANSLDINITYKRHFVGDGTPFPSDALAYPKFDLKIKLSDGNKELKTIEKNGITYKGGFVMNLAVIGATLRDKSHEIKFIDALAETVVKDIESFMN